MNSVHRIPGRDGCLHTVGSVSQGETPQWHSAELNRHGVGRITFRPTCLPEPTYTPPMPAIPPSKPSQSMKYKIIQAASLEELSLEVNIALSMGWAPQGGILHVEGYPFAQAMVKG